MKKNNRKHMLQRALISSVASLLLCCAMLLGTTYAWFTDSVTSGQNRVIAGNLDVRLLTYTENPSGEYSYEDITGVKEKLFKEAWEPGTVKSVNLAVENNGSLDLKYEMGLVIRDGGLADMLEYSIVPVDEKELEVIAEDDDTNAFSNWTSIASDSNADETNRIYYTTIVEERNMVSENTDDDQPMLASDSDSKKQREYFILSVRMKDFVNSDQILQYMGATCEIDVRVIATQQIEEENQTERNRSNLNHTLTEFDNYIYHISTIDVYENDEDNYVTADAVNAESNNGDISLILPEGVQVENPDESEQVTILIAVSPVETSEHFEIEELQTAQATEVRIRALSDDNEIPYTFTQYLNNENTLDAIVYSNDAEEKWIEIHEEAQVDYDPESGFGYAYNQNNSEITVWCAQSGTFTFVFGQSECVAE